MACEKFHGNLKELINHHIERMSMKVKLGVVLQAANGVAFLHRRNVVHNDIKPENFVHRSNGRIVKLIDFGQSEEILVSSDDTEPIGLFGTRGWISPEIHFIRNSLRKPCLNKMKSDIWSFGCVFLFILTGEHFLLKSFRADPQSLDECNDYVLKINEKAATAWPI